MYLEISGRRSGKTTRALNYAREQTAKGNKVFFCCGYRKSVRDEKIEGVRFYQCPKDMETTIEFLKFKESVDLEEKDIVRVYDEYDLFQEEVPVHPNGYYVTTPTKGNSKLRNKLVLANGGHIEQYFHDDYVDETVQEPFI